MSVNSFDDYPMSWRPVLKKSKTPLYLMLAQQLESDIMSGVLRPGTKLPPQRELADFLDLNLSTVSRAFRLCSDKGLLTGSVGSGTYVSYSSITKLTDAPEQRLIRLDAMTPETLELDELMGILRKMLSETGSERLLAAGGCLPPVSPRGMPRSARESAHCRWRSECHSRDIRGAFQARRQTRSRSPHLPRRQKRGKALRRAARSDRAGKRSDERARHPQRR